MSQSPNRPDEGASGPAEYADWRKQVEGVQRILCSKTSMLLRNLKPGNRQSVEAVIKEGSVLFAQLQELEKLHQSRLDDVNRRRDEWQGAVSRRNRETTELEQAVRQQQDRLSLLRQDTDRQQDEMTKVGRELGSLANQRVDAMEKVATLEETSRRHEQSVREEDTRLNARSAALDARQQELESREAGLTRDHQVLDERQRDLAKRQEEELKMEEENRKKSAKIGKRLDVLAEYKDLKSQEVTRLKSQVEALQAENGGFTEARRVLEERTTSSEQDAAAAKAHVVDLQGTIQSQNTELSTLRTVQAEKIRVTKGFMHIASVILPQKEAEITNSKTELAKVKRDTSALNEEMTGRITELDAERSRLQDQFQEQDSRLSQLENDHALLQAAADESSSEADSAKKKLVVAEATTESLNSEVARLQQRHLQLPGEIDRLRRCKVDFDAAIRLQNLSNDKIKDLEEERNNICQERDNLRRERDNLRQERDSIRRERDGNRQQLDTLSIQHKRLGEEAKKNADLQNQAMRKEAETSELLRRRCEASERLNNQTNEENLDLTLQRDELMREKRTLTDQCHDLTEDVHALTGECKDLERLNADLKQDKRDMSRTLEETQVDLEYLTQQLQQCHCSNRRYSRKRRHDQMVSDEEESSSADEADGNIRRKGKEPESRANLDAPGRSDRVDASRTSVSPELPASETEGLKTNNAGQMMNTNAPRALGSANPTITPSDGAAFSISVKDATLLNFSSDVLPIEVLQVLRRKFRVWIANTSFKWATVQSSATNRNCIEARLERKKSEWNDGSGYACAVCARRGRLCVVVPGGDQVLLLPRKAAEGTGEGAMDAVYWTR